MSAIYAKLCIANAAELHNDQVATSNRQNGAELPIRVIIGDLFYSCESRGYRIRTHILDSDGYK